MKNTYPFKLQILVLFGVLFLFSLNGFAQVGIGNANPKSTLDVNGALSLREGPALSLSNNNNEDIDLGTTIYSQYRIEGPTNDFNILTFLTRSGVSANNGQLLTLINTTPHIMTIVDNQGSTGNLQRRIYCPNAENLIIEGKNASVTLQYNTFLARWVVISYTDFGGYGRNLQNEVGTTDINTNSSGAIDMADMNITFIPKHSKVYVNFSASGTMDKGGSSEAQGYADFLLMKDGTTIAGVSTLATDRSYIDGGEPSTSCGEMFYDSGGANGNYSNDETTSRTFEPTNNGEKASVTFLSFNTEEGWDGLMVYDGPNASAPLISSGSSYGYNTTTCPNGAWTGSETYSAAGKNFTSTHSSGALTFIFRSEGATNYSGWEACVNFIVPISCREMFYDSGGRGGNYSNSENNPPRTFNPTNVGEKVSVTFLSFNTEEGYDGLMVYDGPNTSSPLISSGSTYYPETCPNGAWTGTEDFSAIGKTFTSTAPGGELTFVFTPDGSGVRSGWEACVNSILPGSLPAGYSLDTAWNASFTMYPVTVMPGVSTTIKIRWSRDSTGGPPNVLRNNASSDVDRSHRSLTIFD